MNTAYFYLTEEGRMLADRLAAAHPGDIYGKEDFKNTLKEAFGRYDYLVCIMATGIVVRILAPLIVHKTSDPGVVVLDQRGRHAISLLSGHLGGANDLAREMAAISGGEAVITTATDVAGELSFDSFAKSHDMAIENIGQLKHVSGALLSGGTVSVITDYDFPELKEAASQGKMQIFSTEHFRKCADGTGTPAHNRKCEDDTDTGAHDRKCEDESVDTGGDSEMDDQPLQPAVVIDEGLTLSPSQLSQFSTVLYLRPRTIFVGIGCKRNMEAEPIEAAIRQVLSEEKLSPLSVKSISTIPLKADEPGILTTADHFQVPLAIIPTEDIECLNMEELNIGTSEFVTLQTGVPSVSTASAYLASGRGTILRDKVKFKGITVAVCKKCCKL